MALNTQRPRISPSGALALSGQPVTASLATLALLQNYPDGSLVYVLAERESYRLDAASVFTASSPLIVAAPGGGVWFRRSKQYVVGNFTLWACPFGGHFGTGESKIGGFTPGQLVASNANAPEIVLNLAADFPPATTTITAISTDLLGNIWVTGFSNNALTAGAIKKYRLQDILASGTPSAAVSIALTPPTSMSNITAAFDKQNNLWILYGKGGTFGGATLHKFNQATYALSGSPTPDVTLALFNPGVAPATANAEGLSFDSEGNLWISIGFTAGVGPAGGMLMLAASQLNVSNAALVPAVFWSGSNFAAASGSLIMKGSAFGPTGLLWVTSYAGSKVFAWDPRAPTSGNPAPLITLTSTTFNGPISLAFDTAGNLWVANDNNSLIYRLPVASLAASGAVVPDVILSQTGMLAFPSEITFPNNPNRSGFLTSGVPVTP